MEFNQHACRNKLKTEWKAHSYIFLVKDTYMWTEHIAKCLPFWINDMIYEILDGKEALSQKILTHNAALVAL